MAEACADAPASSAMTGNAYAVTIGAEDARIEHLHDPDHPVVTVPINVFRDAARSWAAFLRD